MLNNVSFAARQGEITALVGPSGGGKTTISRLAARFWDTSSGTITVGGMDISQIEPETLLKLYSIVFQDVTLFNTSIMENIRLGKKDATDEEVLLLQDLPTAMNLQIRCPTVTIPKSVRTAAIFQEENAKGYLLPVHF